MQSQRYTQRYSFRCGCHVRADGACRLQEKRRQRDPQMEKRRKETTSLARGDEKETYFSPCDVLFLRQSRPFFDQFSLLNSLRNSQLCQSRVTCSVCHRWHRLGTESLITFPSPPFRPPRASSHPPWPSNELYPGQLYPFFLYRANSERFYSSRNSVSLHGFRC